MKRIPYILLLLALTLAGCHTTINYNGPTEPEKLVLHCEWYANSYTPIVHLSHSFFMREPKKESSYVNDATVEFRIGNGEWQTMKPTGSQGSYTPETGVIEIPQPGDRIEIRASHSKYESVSSIQHVPYPIEVIDGHINGIDKNGLISFDITLAPYEGPSTDVVGIICSGRIERTEHHGNYKPLTQTFNLANIYSLDPVFGRLNNLKTRSGYYGGNYYTATDVHLLYLPANALRETRTISCYTDYTYPITSLVTNTYELIDLQVKLYVGTEDYYRYNNSLRMYREETFLCEPSGIQMEESEFDIDESLNDLAYMLGGQEPVIIYNNIKGGIGHFSAYTLSVFHLK